MTDILAVTSDAVKNGFLTLLGTMFTGLLGYFTLKLRSIGKTADATHTLVNSAMSTQLKLNAVMSRRLANMTKNQTDRDAAALAEKLYEDHEVRQRIVDAREGKQA